MSKLHLFGHNNKNYVKAGDKVVAYKTIIGEIGTANGSWLAHLHHSISDGLTVAQLRAYIKGWSKEKVKKYYIEPKCDYTKMFGRKMDVGKAGWGWLDDIGGGFHPGLDINGLGGGNSDIGYKYTSDCDGKVVYTSETNTKDGWGKMVIVEESKKVSVNLTLQQTPISSEVKLTSNIEPTIENYPNGGIVTEKGVLTEPEAISEFLKESVGISKEEMNKILTEPTFIPDTRINNSVIPENIKLSELPQVEPLKWWQELLLLITNYLKK